MMSQIVNATSLSDKANLSDEADLPNTAKSTKVTDDTNKPIWQIGSETNLILYFPKPVTLAKQEQCWAWADAIKPLDGVLEVVIGMNTLSVFTHPLSFNALNALQEQLNEMSEHIDAKPIKGKHVELPVRYGGEFGPDLKSMAQSLTLSVEDVVKLHTEAVYTVYFIGFQPGFPYLGGLNEKLYFPRRETPRTSVPAGSVGIGGEQTGVYPFSSPGGWQLLGQTDVPLFDLTQNPPTKLSAGDTLQFTAIDIVE